MDIIRVETEEKMLSVINWYDNNSEWISSFKFRPVFLDGVMYRDYDFTYLKFHLENQIYTLTFGTKTRDNEEVDIFRFEYYINEDKLTKARVVGDLPKDRRKSMLEMNESYQLCSKAFTTFMCITEFANHYRQYVVTEEENTKKSSSKKSKNKVPAETIHESKIGNTYYISKVPKTIQGKRAYTQPDHEVKCKGTYRHYKNGKVIWVEPFSRYKDKAKNDADKYYKI